MSSPFSSREGKNRCHPFFRDYMTCMGESKDPRECLDYREDYMECLHHRKEVRIESETLSCNRTADYLT